LGKKEEQEGGGEGEGEVVEKKWNPPIEQ